MDRRRFLVAVSSGLAGCSGLAGRTDPTPAPLTPAPVPEEPTPTPEPERFDDVECLTLDGPTTCAHTQSAGASVRVEADRELVSTTGQLLATLANDGDEPIRFAPGRWGLWVRDEGAWTPTTGGPGGPVLTLAPGASHSWLFLLGDQLAYSELDTTVGRLDIRPGRYAAGLPTEDRTYAVLFDVGETEIRTPGDGNAARVNRERSRTR
jgi:hypothetical protein